MNTLIPIDTVLWTADQIATAYFLSCPDLAEVCHASVVFGLGKELYKTVTVESNDPQWKEEAIVYVVCL